MLDFSVIMCHPKFSNPQNKQKRLIYHEFSRKFPTSIFLGIAGCYTLWNCHHRTSTTVATEWHSVRALVFRVGLWWTRTRLQSKSFLPRRKRQWHHIWIMEISEVMEVTPTSSKSWMTILVLKPMVSLGHPISRNLGRCFILSLSWSFCCFCCLFSDGTRKFSIQYWSCSPSMFTTGCCERLKRFPNLRIVIGM